MHIAVGMIVPGRAGGIYVTEKTLMDELCKEPGVTVEIFEFGSRAEKESPFQRVAGRFKDLIAYDRLLRRSRPDLAYINSSYNKRAVPRDFGYALISRMRRTPLVVKYHGTDLPMVKGKAWFWRFLTKLTFRWSTMVVVLSSMEIQQWTAAGFPAGKLRMLKNVLALERFRHNGAPKLDPPGILFIARFVREKGLFELLRATRKLLDAGKKFTLYCVGDGPIRQEAEALAAELRLGSSVNFTGLIPEEEATRYYLGSTILVLPTYTEGLSMTLLQAAAAGLPIVTTKVGAAPDYLKEPANCLWVDIGDADMIADRLCRLLSAHDLQRSMRENNRRLAEDFSVDAVSKDYLRLFQEAAGATRN